MRYSWKLAGSFLALAILPFAAGGCGSGDTTGVTAAINAPTATMSKTEASYGDAAVRQARRQRSEQERLHPRILLETSLGNVTLELDGEKAPRTVDNFLSYVDRGHYDQTIFHQVVKNYVILGGSYDAKTSTGKLIEKRSRAPVLNEAHRALKNTRGTIAMARRLDGVDTATCQFFINVSDNAMLDHKDNSLAGYGYCAFGRVVTGIEVVDKIANVEVHNVDQFEQIPVQSVVIKSIRRISSRP
jgi:cyclophilin family peptidyl-prolyl cis-trans isomerase